MYYANTFQYILLLGDNKQMKTIYYFCVELKELRSVCHKEWLGMDIHAQAWTSMPGDENNAQAWTLGKK